MRRYNGLFVIGAVALVVLASGVYVSYGQQRDGGTRGGFDPAEMRARMLDRVKENVEVTAEEWEVMKPLIEDVMTKQMESRMRGMRGFGRGGDRGGDRGPQMGEQDPETESLSKALESKETSNDDLKAKLKALREARAKKTEALAQARAKLAKVCSLRQEAALVLQNILE